MKTQFWILVVFCSILCNPLIAQNTPNKAQYEKETIYLSTTKFIKDGKEIRRGGFAAKKLKMELSGSEDALRSYRQFKSNKVTGLILGLVGLGMAVSVSAFDNNDGLQAAFLGGSLGVSILSIPFSIRAERYLQRAVWERNRDVLF